MTPHRARVRHKTSTERTVSNYTEPKTEEIPRLLAEAMGCRLVMGWLLNGKTPDDSPEGFGVICESYAPHLSHDHAQIAVENCVGKTNPSVYASRLRNSMGYFPRNSFEADSPIPLYMCETGMLLATPEQKSRAALRVLTEHRQQKDGR